MPLNKVIIIISQDKKSLRTVAICQLMERSGHLHKNGYERTTIAIQRRSLSARYLITVVTFCGCKDPSKPTIELSNS